LEPDFALPHKCFHILSNDEKSWLIHNCHANRVSLGVNYVQTQKDSNSTPLGMQMDIEPKLETATTIEKGLLAAADLVEIQMESTNIGTSNATPENLGGLKDLIGHLRDLALPVPTYSFEDDDPSLVFFEVWKLYNAAMVPYKYRWQWSPPSKRLNVWLLRKFEYMDHNTNAIAFQYGYGFGPHQTADFVQVLLEIPELLSDIPDDDSDDGKDFHMVT